MGGVRSLVDSVGYFLPSTRAFLASKSDLGEVPFELPKRPVDAMMCANVWRGSGVGGCRAYQNATPWAKRHPPKFGGLENK
jgi:hypothetical protein